MNSNIPYKDQNIDGEVSDWKVIDTASSSFVSYMTGFDATVFQNKQTNEIVIAYRGTDDLLDYFTDGACEICN